LRFSNYRVVVSCFTTCRDLRPKKKKMNLQVILKRIEERKNEIDSFGKFDSKILKAINYKFRLDWNYYSNRAEGGTLTRAETRTVMIGNIDVRGKSIKDVMEMNNHDKVVLEILRISKTEKRISERRIKDIHIGIMYEADISERKKIGKWKSDSNEILNYKGEKISFTQPLDVIEEIHDLLNTTNAELDKVLNNKPSKHPLEIASDFHLGFITIHPFYDGNGRVARVLTNLILISCGFPPIIIKDEHKAAYGRLLADIQVYGGESNLFHTFLGERLLESQQLVLNAIKGISIEDKNDLDKKIALLDLQINAIGDENEIKTVFNIDTFFNVFDSSFSKLVKELIPELQKFNKYFINTNHQLYYRNHSTSFTDEEPNVILNEARNTCLEMQESLEGDYHPTLKLRTFYGTFKKGGLKSFGCNYGFEIEFGHTSYKIYLDKFEGGKTHQGKILFTESLLTEFLTPDQISTIVKDITNSIYSHIEYNISKKD